MGTKDLGKHSCSSLYVYPEKKDISYTVNKNFTYQELVVSVSFLCASGYITKIDAAQVPSTIVKDDKLKLIQNICFYSIYNNGMPYCSY
jgi:hypothetical protein